MIYLTCEKTLLDKGYEAIYNEKYIWCFKCNAYDIVYLRYLNDEDIYVFGFPLKMGGTYVTYYNNEQLDRLEKYVEDIVYNYL